MSVAKAKFSSIGRAGATQTGKSGRVYTINYMTNEVAVTEPTSRPTPTATPRSA